MVKLVTKPEDCKYREECSFYGAVKCKDRQWGNPSECILYNLIEDVHELMDFKRAIESKKQSQNSSEQHPLELENL